MAKFTTREFSRAMADMATVPSQIARVVAKRFSREIQRGFDAGTDPYGQAWAPLKPATLRKGRHPPPLTDTRKGRRSVKFLAGSGAGIQVRVGSGYMAKHQDGTANMARRRILPDARLPATWRAIWQSELTKAVRARLRRG